MSYAENVLNCHSLRRPSYNALPTSENRWCVAKEHLETSAKIALGANEIGTDYWLSPLNYSPAKTENPVPFWCHLSANLVPNRGHYCVWLLVTQ